LSFLAGVAADADLGVNQVLAEDGGFDRFGGFSSGGHGKSFELASAIACALTRLHR